MYFAVFLSLPPHLFSLLLLLPPPLPLPPRYPFDRLYEGNENGQFVPTKEGEATIGSHYILFRRDCWMMSVVDMGIKLTLTSLIGVIYQDSHVSGAFISSICCIGVVVYYAVYKPYAHPCGNIASIASFAALITSYVIS